MKASYLIQRRDFMGFVERRPGYGRVSSYSPWRTIAKAADEPTAMVVLRRSKSMGGLCQIRAMYRGKEIVDL